MICVTLFSSCKEPVTDITLNKNELTLIPGETETLIATVYPADASNDKVTWKSSNPNVATVNNDGLVTAVTNGTVIITVTTQDGNKKAECSVTVDYRNQWVGAYDFTIRYHTYLPYPFENEDTTYSYSGSIAKSVSYSNKILVDWGDNTIGGNNDVVFTQKSELTVDSNGKLTYPEYDIYESYNWYFYGTPYSYISGDTIRFGISTGAAAFALRWEVLGLKTKITNY